MEREESEDRADVGIIAFRVFLEEPVSEGEKSKIEVEETYVHRKQPFPKTMHINDMPKVRVFDNAYYLSFYHSKSTKSTFEFGPGTKIISFTNIEKADEKSHSVRFGAFKDIAPLSVKSVYVHANYDDAIAVFRNVTRTVTVSHWDKIQVDEFYQLHNEIAELKGEFGRIDFNEWKIHHSINWLQCSLPYEAHSLYYVDPVGNVSTSNAYRNAEDVSFRIMPRFPVMGGWKTTWNQGYALPSNSAIKVDKEDSSHYVFTTNLAYSFDKIVAEDFSIKIVLPAGASDIKVKSPVKMDSETFSTTF